MQRSLLESAGWTGQSLVILSLTTAMFFVGVHNVGCGGCHGRQDHAGSFVVMGFFPGSRSLLVLSLLSLAVALSLFLLYQAPLVSWQARRSIPAA